MKAHVLFDQGKAFLPIDGDPHDCPVESDLERLAERVRMGQQVLSKLPVDDIIGLLDALAMAWSRSQLPLIKTLNDLGMGFVPLWMRRNSLEGLLDLNLHGRRECLERFVGLFPGDKRLFRAQPRGILVHWLAGNVPVVGLISLVQGLVSKNGNILKTSHDHAGLIPNLLASFAEVTYTNPRGETLSVKTLFQSVAVIYIDRADNEAARALSSIADVRVAWGGREAVETIMNLPRRFGTEDITFGPKVSFVVIGQERLADEHAAETLALDVARDVNAFDQRGCNSPHTVFIERGGVVTPSQFARLLGGALSQITAGRPLREVNPAEVMTILGLRAEYDMRGEAHYSRGMGWSVMYGDEDAGLAAPCYLRTVFARPVTDVFEVVPYCSLNTQTVGLALDGERRISLADALTARGVERCPNAGGMSFYESPWDGMFPIARMIRWVTTYDRTPN